MQIKFRLLAPAALLAVGLAACGSGNAQTSSVPAANQQQAAATKAPAQGQKKEEPLTGDVKAKAEQAALAKYPGAASRSSRTTTGSRCPSRRGCGATGSTSTA